MHKTAWLSFIGLTFAQMGNETSSAGARSRTTTSGETAHQPQQHEDEYDPYVQGGVSECAQSGRIWMHAKERWSGSRSGIHHKIRIACRILYPVLMGLP